FATKTALPLAKSGLLPDAGASLESCEQATKPAATKLIHKSIHNSFIERSIGSVFKYFVRGQLHKCRASLMRAETHRELL
ncbi:MAG TPA: hypothetical protein VMS25_09095, partial [Candidatus Limnocylindrales bacterium]|nr:hypothetical protein [Candidatus Limnocylindrales bacterium]